MPTRLSVVDSWGWLAVRRAALQGIDMDRGARARPVRMPLRKILMTHLDRRDETGRSSETLKYLVK